MLKDYIFTSESVTEGHPDKISDQVSDAILDALLEKDPNSRVACETLVTTGMIQIAGEITTNANIDYHEVARNTVRKIGYDHSDKGFDANTCGVNLALDKQSPDIAQGVNEGEGVDLDQGAGDQGLMFGYAVNETDSFMPLTIDLSHKLAQRLAYVRHENIVPGLRADGKTQVSAQYVDGAIKRIDAIVVSTQHAESVTQKQLHESIREEVINKTVDPNLIEVLGPASVVEQISQIQATLSVSNATTSIRESHPLQALDEQGRQIKDVILQPNQAQINLAIRRKLNAREAKVNAIISGTPIRATRRPCVKGLFAQITPGRKLQKRHNQ